MRMIGILFALLVFSAGAARAANVGFEQVSVPDGTARPLVVGIWYPTDAQAAPHALGPFTQDVAMSAPIAGARLPMVVFSHGTGGWYGGHYDTALALARAGFVVAAVSHTGDTYDDHSQAALIWIALSPDPPADRLHAGRVAGACAARPRARRHVRLFRRRVHDPGRRRRHARPQRRRAALPDGSDRVRVRGDQAGGPGLADGDRDAAEIRLRPRPAGQGRRRRRAGAWLLVRQKRARRRDRPDAAMARRGRPCAARTGLCRGGGSRPAAGGRLPRGREHGPLRLPQPLQRPDAGARSGRDLRLAPRLRPARPSTPTSTAMWWPFSRRRWARRYSAANAFARAGASAVPRWRSQKPPSRCARTRGCPCGRPG